MPLHIESPADELGRLVVETIPQVMRVIRTEMRAQVVGGLSIPQFRVLIRLYRGEQTNRELAEFQGVSTPAMSRLIHCLLKRGLIERRASDTDRRVFNLALTRTGRFEFEKTREKVIQKINTQLSALTEDRRQCLWEGLEMLQGAFQ